MPCPWTPVTRSDLADDGRALQLSDVPMSSAITTSLISGLFLTA
jgi:hypothetical protein